MALPVVDKAARLERLIARAEPGLRRALQNAIAAATATSTLRELADLIAAGLFEQAIEVAARAGAIRLSDEFAAVYTLAGQEGAKFLEDVLEVVIGFDQVNTRAVRIMQEQRLRLIREFTAEQRRATREALVEGIRRGDNPLQQARNFRASIGLTERQTIAVANFRRLLEGGSREALSRTLRDRRFDPTIERAIKTGEPLTQAQINRMVRRYYERSIASRAFAIARTEALAAVHMGTEEAYEQAIEAGDLDADQLTRTWHTARDERVRGTHVILNGLKRAVGEMFGPLRFPGDPQAPAAERIRCRCALSTRIDEVTG